MWLIFIIWSYHEYGKEEQDLFSAFKFPNFQLFFYHTLKEEDILQSWFHFLPQNLAPLSFTWILYQHDIYSLFTQSVKYK